MESIALRIEPGLYVVARGPLPKGATALLDPDCLRCEFHGAGETSSVFPESDLQATDPDASTLEAERGWRWLRVDGPLPFSAVGILAAIAGPLAAAEIPIFVVSSFDTDHILIPETRLESSVAALRGAGLLVDGA